MEREFQIWQLERNLLIQRLQVFLFTNSILFLGFVQLRSLWLGTAVALLGFASCILGVIHFQGLKRRFRVLRESKEMREIEDKFGIGERMLSGRLIVVAFLVVFTIIWIASVIYSFFQWVC